MRYLFGVLCVCALGLMPLVGCSDECEVPADCPGDLCTEPGNEDCVGGVCTYEPIVCADDDDDCTADPACDPAVGCEKPTVVDGTPCAGGTCQAGVCELTDSVLPCTEQGIRNAIAAGGDEPYTFDCDGPTTVMGRFVIDNDVILDGGGNLTVEGNEGHAVFVVTGEVTAQLRGFTVTRGGSYDVGLGDAARVEGCIENSGILTVTDTTVSDNGLGIVNGRTLTLTNSTVTDNEHWGIASEGTLTLRNSTVSGNADEDRNGISVLRGDVALLYTTVSDNIYVEIREGDATIVSTATLIDGACTTAAGSMVTWTSNGYNIESPGDTCGFDQTGDQSGVSAVLLDLQPLADNDGPTQTHALGVGSVALDRIPEVDCEVETDQRGEPRPETGGTMCDVGAFEVQPEL